MYAVRAYGRDDELLYRFDGHRSLDTVLEDVANWIGNVEVARIEIRKGTDMAKKTLTLTDAQKAQCEAMGIDWKKLIDNAAKFLQLLLDLFNQNKPAARAGLAAGCCDHHACCHATLCSALQTAALAAEHCCQCDQEPE